MVLSGGYFEIMSSTIAPILLCVGIGDSIHMLTKFNDGVYNGLDRRESIIEMIRTLGTATLMTSITTAVGFATLMVSNVMPMQRFGLYTAIGVMVAFVATILFLPSFIWVFKRKNLTLKSESWSEKFMDKGLLRISDWVQQNYKMISITGLLFALVVGLGAFKLRINSKVFDDIGSDSELIQNVNKISEALVPTVQIDVILNTGEPEGVFKGDVHEVLAQLEAHLKTIPQLKQIRGLGTSLQEIHEELTGNKTPFYAKEEQTSNYFFLLELSSAEILKTYVDFDYQTIRLTAFMDDLGSYEVNQVREAILAYTSTRFPQLDITLSGTGILVADLAYNLVYSLNSSIYLALGIIGLFMFWMFRSPSLSLIALLPNLLPLIITAGVMGWLGVALKPSTAVIFTISFGIAVDDTIHFLARYRIEKQRLGNPFTSIFTTILRTGKAIIITSIILMMGFGVLVTSTFESTFLMGLLVCLTIVTAVLYDLLVLPSILAWYFEKHQEPTLLDIREVHTAVEA
jgi:predicted RND superfamily exporter protein